MMALSHLGIGTYLKMLTEENQHQGSDKGDAVMQVANCDVAMHMAMHSPLVQRARQTMHQPRATMHMAQAKMHRQAPPSLNTIMHHHMAQVTMMHHHRHQACVTMMHHHHCHRHQARVAMMRHRHQHHHQA